MRKGLGWISGVITLFLMYLLFTWISKLTGVPFQLDNTLTTIVNYGHGVEIETDNSITTVGYLAIIISLMVSTRVGYATTYGNFKSKFSSKERVDFRIWIQGLSVYLFLCIIIQQGFKRDYNHGFFSGKSALEITVLIGTFLLFKQLRTNKIKELQYNENMTLDFHVLTSYGTHYGSMSIDGYYKKGLSTLTGIITEDGEVYRYENEFGNQGKVLVGTVDNHCHVRDIYSNLVGFATGDGKILDHELKHIGWVGRLSENNLTVIYDSQETNFARRKGAAARLLLDSFPDIEE